MRLMLVPLLITALLPLFGIAAPDVSISNLLTIPGCDDGRIIQPTEWPMAFSFCSSFIVEATETRSQLRTVTAPLRTTLTSISLSTTTLADLNVTTTTFKPLTSRLTRTWTAYYPNTNTTTTESRSTITTVQAIGTVTQVLPRHFHDWHRGNPNRPWNSFPPPYAPRPGPWYPWYGPYLDPKISQACSCLLRRTTTASLTAATTVYVTPAAVSLSRVITAGPTGTRQFTDIVAVTIYTTVTTEITLGPLRTSTAIATAMQNFTETATSIVTTLTSLSRFYCNLAFAECCSSTSTTSGLVGYGCNNNLNYGPGLCDDERPAGLCCSSLILINPSMATNCYLPTPR
ncbi:hypothetical protein B0H67DRAFT_580129 [Lasiosphaeris hirsuta]|uniref:Uncharacterized protein n=1 Tax=Lasiosphaeris hirsuta TaxID=260670 RepID=A0AA40AG10_9PEZI|nr:hypothetical protein B0H67DRAFT_580129 [Lasiosphaeris hirsuta]